MEKIHILVNNEKDKGLEKTRALAQFLELRGKKVEYTVIERVYKKNEEREKVFNCVSEDTDLIVTLGGDGTFIEVAGIMTHKDIPMLGVNMGHLGYLTETDKDSVFKALEKVMRGEYSIEERMMLCGEVQLKDVKLSHFHALNDVVIARKGEFRIIEFTVYVNHKKLYDCCADGMIISTPTGSTAYNFSAGGPIVAPYAKDIVLTPICAHSLTVTPIVLSENDEITIEIRDERGSGGEGVEVLFDGDMGCPVTVGSLINVKKSVYTTKLVKLEDDSFFDTLSKKMVDIY